VFWLMLAGWHVLGVSEIWARLIAAIAGAGCFAATAALAHQLWPDRVEIARRAPLVLVGLPLFAVFGGLAMFDVPLAAAVAMGHLGVALAWRGGRLTGWLLLGLALGAGALTKGPVILLHLMPVPLLAPLWTGDALRGGWTRWYLGLAGAIGLGSSVAFAWAIPAADNGGTGYAAAILWGQTMGRIGRSFAHAQPFWWYLPLVPLVLYPWAWLPTAWRGAPRLAWDPGSRFVAVWLLVPFAGFCLISGKQPNYLIPLLPAYALLVGRWLEESRTRAWDVAVPLAPLALLAVVALAAPFLSPSAAAGMEGVPHAIPLAFVAVVLASATLPRVGAIHRILLATVSAFAIVHIGFALGPSERYDVAPLARLIAEAQRSGLATAHVAGYEGHLGFVGRLQAPVEEVRERDLQRWAAEHPGGFVIATIRDIARLPEAPMFKHPYRGRWSVVWRSEAILRLGRARVVGY
jgi:4-amino-4-deoxy-L-arabinose transferase-like glycosyltransferase